MTIFGPPAGRDLHLLGLSLRKVAQLSARDRLEYDDQVIHYCIRRAWRLWSETGGDVRIILDYVRGKTLDALAPIRTYSWPTNYDKYLVDQTRKYHEEVVCFLYFVGLHLEEHRLSMLGDLRTNGPVAIARWVDALSVLAIDPFVVGRLCHPDRTEVTLAQVEHILGERTNPGIACERILAELDQAEALEQIATRKFGMSFERYSRPARHMFEGSTPFISVRQTSELEGASTEWQTHGILHRFHSGNLASPVGPRCLES